MLVPKPSLTPLAEGRWARNTLARVERSRLPAISPRRLTEMVEETTVDCHDASVQLAGLFTMMEEHLEAPFETTVLGVTVTVERIDLDLGEQIIAVCRRGRHGQSLPILGPPARASPERSGVDRGIPAVAHPRSDRRGDDRAATCSSGSRRRADPPLVRTGRRGEFCEGASACDLCAESWQQRAPSGPWAYDTARRRSRSACHLRRNPSVKEAACPDRIGHSRSSAKARATICCVGSADQ
jgi:hypothetical protein